MPLNWQLADSFEFQSTHPRGVRPQVIDHPLTDNLRFNPRTREGCDQFKFIFTIFGSCSFNPRTREGCDAFEGILSNNSP